MELYGQKKELFDLVRDGHVPKGFKSLVKSLPDVRDKNHLTPLIVACLNGNLQSVKALMQIDIIKLNAQIPKQQYGPKPRVPNLVPLLPQQC